MNSFVVSDGFTGRLGTVTIPMDCFRIYQLHPSPFFWLHLLKNPFKETKLLNTNLWAPSTCRENRRLKERTIADECKKYLQIWTDAYEMSVILPKLCRRAYTPSLLDGSSIRHPLGRSNDSSSLYLSQVFQKWPSATGSYWQNYKFPLTCQSHLDGSNEGIHASSASMNRLSLHHRESPWLWRPSKHLGISGRRTNPDILKALYEVYLAKT